MGVIPNHIAVGGGYESHLKRVSLNPNQERNFKEGY